MLYWICPECGHECSPAIRECPTCALASQSAPPAPSLSQGQSGQAQSDVSHEIAALAESFAAPAPVSTKAAAPVTESVTSANGQEEPKPSGALIAVEEPVDIEETKTPAAVVDSLVRPLVESVKEEPAKSAPEKAATAPPAAPLMTPPATDLRAAEPDTSEPLRPRADTAPRLRSAPAMLSSVRPRIELDLLPPMATGLAPITGAETQSAEPLQPKALRLLNSAPPPAPTPTVIAIQAARTDLHLTSAGLVALSEALREPAPSLPDEPQSVAATPRVREARLAGPVFGSAHVEIASEPLALPEPKAPGYDEEVVEQALEQQAASLLEAIEERTPSQAEAPNSTALSQALELEASAVVDEVNRAVEAEESGIRSVVETFQEQPATSLLAAPAEIVVAPAPPATQWLRTARPVLKPYSAPDPSIHLLTRGPQVPSLAGPCLPPQLQHFVEEISPVAGTARKPIAFPTWLVSVVVATCLFLGAGSLVQYLTASRDAKAASPAPSAQTSVVPPAAAIPPAPVVQEHPQARFVEVAGVRIVSGANRKPQLEYIVVNHSGSDLTGLDIRIAGRSADAPSGDPLFSVSQVIGSLGAYQSKEIHLDLDARLRAANIPDWQSLKTEVLIARH